MSLRPSIPSAEINRELRDLSCLIDSEQSDTSADLWNESSAADIIAKLDYHGITTLAIEAGKLPEPARSELAERKMLAIANEALQKKALDSLFSFFFSKGLNTHILFKGSALAYSVYPSPWLRPRSDSDLLIDKRDLDKYTKAFIALGYHQQFGITGDYVSYQQTFSKHLVGDASINIDLHWQISNRQCLAHCYSVQKLLLEGHSTNGFNVPNPQDSLLIACLHRLGHHHREERLAWLYDIHLLASQMTESAWQSLLAKTAEKRLASICLDAIKTSQFLWNTPISNYVLDELHQQSLGNELSKSLLKRDLSDWQMFLLDIRSMTGVRAKLGFVRENLLPPASYVKQQMGTNSLIYAYFLRTVKGLKRLLN